MFKTSEEKSIFLTLIQNGLGLSGACIKMGLSIKEVSEVYQRDEEWKNSIDKAFMLGLAEVALEVQRSRGTEKHGEAKKVLNRFPSKPVLWACGLNEFQLEVLQEEGVIPITEGMIKTAVAMCGNLPDVATSLCLQYKELMDLINQNFALKDWMDGL